MEHAIAEVARKIGNQEPFERIEAWIEALPLTEDERAVLWLCAWAGAEPAEVAAGLGRERRLALSYG